MTMPNKIWAWEYKGNTPWGEKEPDPKFTKGVQAQYIRADIADELALALNNALSGKMQRGPDVWAHAEEALSRHSATKEPQNEPS